MSRMAAADSAIGTSFPKSLHILPELFLDLLGSSVELLSVAANPLDQILGLLPGDPMLSSEVSDLVSLAARHLPAISAASLALIVSHSPLLKVATGLLGDAFLD